LQGKATEYRLVFDRTSFNRHRKLPLAGAWYGYVSVPILQFLVFRWYYRILIWERLLWQVSRIELSLVPTAPDRAGGPGVLTFTPRAFALLLVAHGVVLAAGLANQISTSGPTRHSSSSRLCWS
jgi:hypothetical protein